MTDPLEIAARLCDSVSRSGYVQSLSEEDRVQLWIEVLKMIAPKIPTQVDPWGGSVDPVTVSVDPMSGVPKYFLAPAPIGPPHSIYPGNTPGYSGILGQPVGSSVPNTSPSGLKSMMFYPSLAVDDKVTDFFEAEIEADKAEEIEIDKILAPAPKPSPSSLYP